MEIRYAKVIIRPENFIGILWYRQNQPSTRHIGRRGDCVMFEVLVDDAGSSGL